MSNYSIDDTSNGHTANGHTAQVWTVGFSPDGELLASASDDKTIKLWNLNTEENATTLQGHQEWIWVSE